LKKILIISPHFPPSNLAAVHRSRLFAQHLPSFGWQPTILTVHKDFYEENLDHNLTKLLPVSLHIEKVGAFKTTKPRLIGDIGIRAFFQLYTKAKKIIKKDHFDFLYIPIPSFYVALLGRWLHETTGIKYGIDYIDPWVHDFPGSDKIFTRHWFSKHFARFLEPIAIKKASLITGVAQGYYKGVQERNPAVAKKAVFAAMPYGGEKADHDAVKTIKIEPYLFSKKNTKIQLVYAGAMLPKAFMPLQKILSAISTEREKFQHLELHFIGTGTSPGNAQGYNIKPLAEKYGLWQKNVFEYPARIPYLDALVHLNAATGVFILGSTEPHYTPSKVYQAILSQKPVWAVLHKESTACNIIHKSGAGIVLEFSGEKDVNTIFENLARSFDEFKRYADAYNFNTVNQTEFEKYSAKEVTAILADSLNKVC
jgi:hypothetical protein